MNLTKNCCLGGMARHIFVLGIILLGSSSAFSTDYYVDATSGDDSWTGKAKTFTTSSPPIGPWKSLVKVFAYGRSPGYQPGDKILIKRGEEFYAGDPSIASTGTVVGNFGSSGSAGNPIILDVYGAGEKPIVRLRVKLTSDSDWTASAAYPGVWETNTNYGAQDMWEDDIALRKATSPDCTDGNWYYDSSVSANLYYKPKVGIPEDHAVHYGRNGNMDFTDLSYITIRNIHFRTSALPIRVKAELNEATDITVEHCDFYSPKYGMDIWARSNHIRRIKALNNTFTYAIRSVSFTIDGTMKHYDGEVGYNTVLDSNIFDAWVGDHESVYMQNIQNTHIHHNTIIGGPVSGISMWENDGSVGNIIEYNFIKDLIWPVYGYARTAIAAFTAPHIRDITYGNKIRYNIIDHCDRGIRTNSGVEFQPGNEFTNNTIVNSGISFDPNFNTHGVIFKNNISLNPQATPSVPVPLHVLRERPGNLITMEKNLYYPNVAGLWSYEFAGVPYDFAGWQQASGLDQASPTPSDPLLLVSNPVNPGDYRLTSTSPSIDAGVDVGLIADYADNPILGLPDIGAYEFGHNDTDNDGLTDYQEICYDGDCQTNDPYDAVTNPGGGDSNINNADSDGDGVQDGAEVAAGFDPLDANSVVASSAVAAPLLSRPILIALCVFLIVFGASALRNRL